MRQLELDFDAIPGVVQILPYLQHSSQKRPRRKAGAEIKAFPLSRQRSTIQEVALQFKAKRGKKRQEFWENTVAELRESLREIGLSDDTIRRQLVAFRDAVQHELYSREDDPRFGGAA